MKSAETVEEHRNSPRLRVLKMGKIVFNHRNATIDCLVRNLSKTGAALEIENPVGIPDVFDLMIERDSLNRRCRVVWRKARRIGVRFD